jgi:hypothetical protein
MSITVSPSPEMKMSGVKKQMIIRILEAKRGGFVIIYDDAMAARSSWDEVLDSIAEAGVDLLGVERMVMPKVLDRSDRHSQEDGSGGMRNTLKDAVHTISLVTASLAGMALSLLSVKIA